MHTYIHTHTYIPDWHSAIITNNSTKRQLSNVEYALCIEVDEACCMYVCLYVCMYVCMYVCVRMYVCMYVPF